MIWDERIDEKLRNHDAYETGKDEGFMNGVEQNKTEMIINFYQNGASLELISKSSGLSIKEIEKIIEDNDNNRE